MNENSEDILGGGNAKEEIYSRDRKKENDGIKSFQSRLYLPKVDQQENLAPITKEIRDEQFWIHSN